jgi:hypothetical protein
MTNEMLLDYINGCSQPIVFIYHGPTNHRITWMDHENKLYADSMIKDPSEIKETLKLIKDLIKSDKVRTRGEWHEPYKNAPYKDMRSCGPLVYTNMVKKDELCEIDIPIRIENGNESYQIYYKITKWVEDKR